jgi:cytochrome c biogenesis factor
MGLIPQHEGGGLLTAVASSWPFVFVYLLLLLSLGCVVARSLMGFDIRRWGFYLNHVGLWLVFAGAGLGRADYRELTVKIPEGETATHGITAEMMPCPLPVALRLDDFRMEEYPSGMPKSFTSAVTATSPDDGEEQASIEVNHPYRYGAWAFYQSGYDRQAGSGSAYSIFKAVRDPWLPVVYAGIVMLALGAFSLFMRKPGK